jgi:hypothetical protein
MQIINNVIKILIKSYIFLNEITFSCKNIIKMLAIKYKLIKNQIIEQIQNEVQDLK